MTGFTIVSNTKQGFPNRSSVYALHLAPSLEPRFRTGLTGNLVIRGFNSPRSAVDKKSIFVGNLPESTTRRDLEELFKEFGSILHSTVIKKPIGKRVLGNSSDLVWSQLTCLQANTA